MFLVMLDLLFCQLWELLGYQKSKQSDILIFYCLQGKPKSTLKGGGNPEQAPDPQNKGPPRQPLSPLQHN